MLTPVAPASAGQQPAGALPRPLEPVDLFRHLAKRRNREPRARFHFSSSRVPSAVRRVRHPRLHGNSGQPGLAHGTTAQRRRGPDGAILFHDPLCLGFANFATIGHAGKGVRKKNRLAPSNLHWLLAARAHDRSDDWCSEVFAHVDLHKGHDPVNRIPNPTFVVNVELGRCVSAPRSNGRHSDKRFRQGGCYKAMRAETLRQTGQPSQARRGSGPSPGPNAGAMICLIRASVQAR